MIALARTQPFYGLKFEGRSFDCGSKIGFLAANVAYALERADIAPELRAETAPPARREIACPSDCDHRSHCEPQPEQEHAGGVVVCR